MNKLIINKRKIVLELLAIFSLVNLSFLLVYEELLFARPSDIYYLPDYTRASHIAIILNVILVTIFLWLVWRLMQYSKSDFMLNVGRAGFLLLAIFPLNYLRVCLGINSKQAYWLIDHPAAASAIVVLFSMISYYIIKKHFTMLTRAVSVLLLVLSPFGFLSLGHATWGAVTAPASSDRPWMHATPTVDRRSDPSEERVLWLMFDELDLRLAFTERPNGVELPAFDRFRASSLFATNGKSHSKDTMEAIPSYLMGRIVGRAKPGSKDTLLVCLEGSDDENSFLDFRSFPSFFDDLKTMGLNAGIIGFYHPYGRLFSKVYPSSYSYSMGSFCIQATNSIPKEMASQLIGITPLYKRINAIKTYASILEDTKRLVKDPGYDVVFVHAPVPHGPDVYDRRSDSFSPFIFSKDGYFGNLELADMFLAEVRKELEKADLWNRTSILITSDHEWRHVYLYDHVRTRKVPFLLKLRNQREPDVIPHEFSPMVVTRSLLIRLLKGEVMNKETVVRCILRG